MITVKRKCPVTGEPVSRQIPTTQAKFALWESKQISTMIQVFFSELSDEDREFIMTGCTPEVWDEMFKLNDENE